MFFSVTSASETFVSLLFCHLMTLECLLSAPPSSSGPSPSPHVVQLAHPPRPRNRDVESRLRNLESLLASISNGNSSAALTLSRRELDQIRVAAHITPGPEASPGSDNDANRESKPWVGTPSEATATPNPNASTTPTAQLAPTPTAVNTNGNMPPPNVAQMDGNYVPSVVFDPFGVPIPSQQQIPNTMVSGMDQTLGPAVNDPTLYGGGMRSPQHTKAGKDLLYRDAEGQTKWLGPSSGMPLLERLKVNGNWNPPLDDNGNALTDEWMSLTNAIGVDVGNAQHLNEFASAHPSAAVSPSSANDDFIWERVTNVVPSDLVDSLVRSYFTISHLREYFSMDIKPS